MAGTMIEHLDTWFRELAEAGARLSQIGALEGAAGNISLFLPAETPELLQYVTSVYSERVNIDLSGHAGLPPGVILITGTGRRLRDIASRPGAVLCAILIEESGRTMLHRALGHNVEPTSEIDSHLSIHASCLGGEPSVHAIIHAQPPSLTFLSHIPAYRQHERLNRQLLRWQPETFVMLPEGIGVLPFETPGTARQGVGTAWAMRHQRLVIWAKHGVVARSARGPMAAADLIDYAEAAAIYEVNDLQAGRPADGLTLAEMRAIASRFGVSTSLLDRLPEDLLA
jgi:rhamnulose-1-phosphate aldolase